MFYEGIFCVYNFLYYMYIVFKMKTVKTAIMNRYLYLYGFDVDKNKFKKDIYNIYQIW